MMSLENEQTGQERAIGISDIRKWVLVGLLVYVVSFFVINGLFYLDREIFQTHWTSQPQWESYGVYRFLDLFYWPLVGLLTLLKIVDGVHWSAPMFEIGCELTGNWSGR